MIYGISRIKNEQRWIARVVGAQLMVADHLFILDDHSTDDTAAICRSFPRVTVFDSPFEGLDETRDKNWLLEKLAEVAKPGEWCLSIDGDEELAPGSAAQIRQLAARTEGPDSYRFQVLYLWDSPDQVRMDGIYSRFHRSSFFRFRRGARFHSHTGGGFHCGNVPEPFEVGVSDVKILHYGYMYKADRIRKWHWYSSIDPTNTGEGYDADFPERLCYPHIAQGDVPEIPADAVLKHGGPLRLESLKVAV